MNVLARPQFEVDGFGFFLFFYFFFIFEMLQVREHSLWAILEPLVSPRKGHGSVPNAAHWPQDELFPARLAVGVSGCLVTLQTTYDC